MRKWGKLVSKYKEVEDHNSETGMITKPGSSMTKFLSDLHLNNMEQLCPIEKFPEINTELSGIFF